MKTLGLLGGMSWESTSEYYRLINKNVQEKLGGLHSASCIIHSFNFAKIASLQEEGEWNKLEDILAEAAAGLENSGAEALILCTNTMHALAEAVEDRLQVPLLHVADAAAKAIKKQGIQTVGLTGTSFTMNRDFYKDKLKKYGIDVLIPEESDRNRLHTIIFNELCRGRIEESSRQECLRIFDRLSSRGAAGIVLGCTELPLLVYPEHTSLPLFDTTKLHSEQAAAFSLQDEPRAAD